MSRYSRQLLFAPLGPAGQKRARDARVLVVGCGALGTHAAELLARAGVGTLVLVDRDVVDATNLHRQGAFEEAHARDRVPKVEALAGWIRRINSEVVVEAHARDFHPGIALELSGGADLLLDGTDNVPTRFLLNDVSYRLAIPWIYAGAVGAEGALQVFSGRAGPCLRCLLPELPAPGAIATCDTSGVLGPVPAIVGAWQAALALRVLVEGPEPLAGVRLRLDAWRLAARTATVLPAPDCPVCVKGTFEALEGAFASRATPLCGREAVQVLPSPSRATPLDLPLLALRLREHGRVEERPLHLRLEAEGGLTLILFADGRALVEGTDDADLARALYRRWIDP